nr:peptidoglycan endopeptidase [Thermoleophilaceae bacterium]
PYRLGGGHGDFEDTHYDCSGAVSYALHGGRLLDAPLASGGLMSWGERGRGRWITVYANRGHTFIVIAGLRFDTGYRDATREDTGTGPRWGSPRPARGYRVRHPAGL